MAQVANQKWDYSTMRNERQNLATQGQNFQEIKQKMQNVVDVLDQALQGDSLVEYKSSHSSVMGQYVKLEEMLKSMETSLENAINHMQQADASNAQWIRSHVI